MNKKFIILFFLFCGIIFAPFTWSYQESELPQAELPVLATSAGQSPDVTTLNIIMEEAGIPYDYCDVPKVDLIKSGVGLAGKESGPGFHVEIHTNLDEYPKGTPYKTIVFAIGASLKGMGASGLTVESEIKRLKNILDYCKQNDVFVIGVHVGGASKRGAPGSDNERMISTVAPQSDYLVVTKDSNKDGRFTEISEKNNIPLTEVDYALDLVDIFKKVFKQ